MSRSHGCAGRAPAVATRDARGLAPHAARGRVRCIARAFLYLLVALLAAVAVLPVVPAALRAQQTDSASQRRSFEEQRAEAERAMQRAQDQLAALRMERVRLQARLEVAEATQLEARAQQLLMSREQGALRSLDSALTAAQSNMLDQRERMRALGEAVRRRSGAVLVVLLRADSTQSQTLDSAEVLVDSVSVATRAYSATLNAALQAGAVDQLYRAPVLPVAHTVVVRLVVNGRPLEQRTTVAAPEQANTYVEFVVRNGQLVPGTWTSRDTPPR